jgi:hypothetical protein
MSAAFVPIGEAGEEATVKSAKQMLIRVRSSFILESTDVKSGCTAP